MSIKEQNLKEIQEIQKWKGKGTEDNPLIMDFINKSGENLILKSIISYIIIKNLQAHHVTLSLIKCQNIKIQNCHISGLYMKFCQKICVEDNIINLIKAPYSRNCIIRNNKINSDNLNFNSINKHAEHVIFREYFTNFLGFSWGSFIFGFFLIILGLMIFVSSAESLIILGIFFFIFAGICLPYAILTGIQISKIKKLANNTYENNLAEK